MSRTSAQIRKELASILPLDLVGPWPGHPFESEVLPQAPSRFYLTGFLVPYEADEDQRTDPTAQEQLALGADGGGTDDDETPEQTSARKVHFPSSLGASVLVRGEGKSLVATVTWGDYALEGTEQPEGEDAPPPSQRTPRHGWRRAQHRESVTIDLKKKRQTIDVPHSDGLRLVVSMRKIADEIDLVPKGTRAVSVFLVNHRQPAEDVRRDEAFIFQAGMELRCDVGFCPRPNVRGRASTDWDERVADLQYREVAEYAVGHGIATKTTIDADKTCRVIETVWIPRAEVEKVVPAAADVELGMEALAKAASGAELAALLRPLAVGYADWITKQKSTVIADARRGATATELMRRAEIAQKRILSGIALLEDTARPEVFDAFRLANRAMAKQARQRLKDFDATGDAPHWRPFQLAFILLNLRALVEPTHADRETVDLLFFPTGGGKTEAYLGLAAFALVLRRLRNPGIGSAGLTVLMRYTLRLLTLDQLGRAATLMCALELEREHDVERLGKWPFEIGLWVGQAATPNRMGRKGDNDRHSARARTIAFQNDTKKPSPIPLENCPWCDTKFSAQSFVLMANGRTNNDQPTDLRVYCVNRRCEFTGAKKRPLPVLAVDEPIYRRLPCFLIATVDKFASLPWVGETGALFGKVDRWDDEGFYGTTDPLRGRPLERQLLPPELVIQDELHLISGPLGTMVGLYETAIDALATRTIDGKSVRPKVVASTATVRRADKQIRALFTRPEVEVFPPPGADIRDSFFAKTVGASDADSPSPNTRNARLYLGVAAPGRSMKVILLRTCLTLMAAAQRAYEAEGGAKAKDSAADPYMTLLGYFNSLRELGGSRRIVEDEVRSRLVGYHKRLRIEQKEPQFAERHIAYEVVELTSREPTSKVADTKRRLGLVHADKEHVDVALATNMISVGLDITRLGLMVVLGQPKTAAEYIQATSRVGRDDARPGLVITLLNVHKPRDRSHYERFEAFHASFYRAVEATSVTPFAPRAVDRGLAGVTVALARHGVADLEPASHAVQIQRVRGKLGFVEDALGRRYAEHDADLARAEVDKQEKKLRRRVEDLLDAWAKIAHDQQQVGAGLQYQREEGGAPALLYDPLDPELKKRPAIARKFKAQRSLRDVEPSVNLWVKSLDGMDVIVEEDDT